MNSLRRDIHAAFEVIEPPLGGMPERVVETVLAENKRRKKGMTFRARMPLPLVAAFVAVALVATVLIGNQLIQAWSAAHAPAPAGQVHLTSLQQLEARPIQLPRLKTPEDCVPGPYTSAGDWGSGPLFGYAGSATTTRWGEYFYTVLYTDKSITGPILVRVTNLLTGSPLAVVAPFAAGPALGTDVVDSAKVTQRTELALDEGHTTSGGWQQGWPIDHHRYVWDFMLGVSGTPPIAIGWQIDGLNFTETFRVC